MKENERHTYPNLVIIGAQKSGTTTLHFLLHQHSNISMAHPIKEAHYFFPLEAINKNLSVYNLQQVKSRSELCKIHMTPPFKTLKYFGESPTGYTFSENASKFGVPERMYNTDRNIKIIYIVRDPVERLRSAYYHFCKRRSHITYVDWLQSPMFQSAIRTSLYSEQITAYLSYFEPQNIHVVQFERLINFDDLVIRELYDFLQIDYEELTLPKKNANRLSKPGEISLGLPDGVSERLYADAVRFAKLWNLDHAKWRLLQ